MARRPGHILPFRIPFFRIFYSTTYTGLYIFCICVLAITPVSMIWSAIQNSAYQYPFMIGGTYFITALLAIFIYASRLYTNRSVLAAVGKAYIPIERGEVGNSVRKMIVKQLERSAIIAWESRPRDLYGEILQAEARGLLPPESSDANRNDYTVGREVCVDPAFAPWGDIQHAGWSSPSHKDDSQMPDLQFATVIAELPNLIEAKAVSLAPADPTVVAAGGRQTADPVIFEALRRPQNMGSRSYLARLSHLGLVNPANAGQVFLTLYERARFGARPTEDGEFKNIMSAFAVLLAGMTGLDDVILSRIRAQARTSAKLEHMPDQASGDHYAVDATEANSPSQSRESSMVAPITSTTDQTQPTTAGMYRRNNMAESNESLDSVVRNIPQAQQQVPRTPTGDDASSDLPSESDQYSIAGSVIHHHIEAG